jgi:lipopolysaccharide biosynthesis glycosyltransferase
MAQNVIPIVFAFDNNLVMPATICISSLMMNAKEDTFYDIFILHSEKENLNTTELDRIPQYFPNCRIQYRQVDGTFDKSFEIRGITTPAYYRLLIPELIPEYDKILYSDVDVVFRSDLSDIYNIPLGECYFAGVRSLYHMFNDTIKYCNEVSLNPRNVIYSGNLIINSKKILEDDIIPEFKKHIHKKYKYQDMDIINIVCKDRICYLPPFYCWTNFINKLAVEDIDSISDVFSKDDVEYAKQYGIVHYNGQKPWKGYCVNFDIWWEYYRKSPIYDNKFYFNFFYNKQGELDKLPFVKRLKILMRFFIYGNK